MWLKVGYKYRLSTLPSTTFMTACCVLLLLSLQLSGRADCFSVSFQGLRTNERTNDRTFTWPGFTTVSVLERGREREQSAGATWGKRLDRLSPSGFLQSTLCKCALSPDQLAAAAAAFTVSPVCYTSDQPCFVFSNDESSLIIMGQQWLIILVAVLESLNCTAGCLLGRTRATCCISQTSFVCLCVSVLCPSLSLPSDCLCWHSPVL